MTNTVDFKEYLIESLKDEQTAKAYITAALEDYEDDNNMEDFLIALKDVAAARGGIATLAKKTHLSRESLYRTLSEKGNPRLGTLVTILRELGLRLTVDTAAATS
jgi:probable addiction module antidote protein